MARRAAGLQALGDASVLWAALQLTASEQAASSEIAGQLVESAGALS